MDKALTALAEVKAGGYFKELGFEKYIDYVAHICLT